MIPVPEGCELTPIEGGPWSDLHTPFLDPSNDVIYLCVKEENGIFTLSDDAQAANYLFLHGFEDDKVRPVMQRICRGAPGIGLDYPEIKAQCTLKDFIHIYHYLIGCILQTEAAVMWRKCE